MISGYRIVLTYNMFHVGPSATPGITNGDPRLVALQTNLKEWSDALERDEDDLASDPLPGHLIYALIHEYTDESLRLSGLKGEDHTRFKSLLSIAEAANCECFLATIEKREHGACNGSGPEDYRSDELHSLATVDEESIHLRSIVAVDGTLVLQDVAIEEHGELMREDDYDSFGVFGPIDEEFEGWTGNEGARTTLWYRESAILVLSGRNNFGFFQSAVQESEATYKQNYVNLVRYSGMLADSDEYNSKGELDYLVGVLGEGPQSADGQKLLTMWPAGTWPRLHSGQQFAAAAGACLRAGWLDRFGQVLNDQSDLSYRLEVEDFGDFLPFLGRYKFEPLTKG